MSSGTPSGERHEDPGWWSGDETRGGRGKSEVFSPDPWTIVETYKEMTCVEVLKGIDVWATGLSGVHSSLDYNHRRVAFTMTTRSTLHEDVYFL